MRLLIHYYCPLLWWLLVHAATTTPAMMASAWQPRRRRSPLLTRVLRYNSGDDAIMVLEQQDDDTLLWKYAIDSSSRVEQKAPEGSRLEDEAVANFDGEDQHSDMRTAQQIAAPIKTGYASVVVIADHLSTPRSCTDGKVQFPESSLELRDLTARRTAAFLKKLPILDNSSYSSKLLRYFAPGGSHGIALGGIRKKRRFDPDDIKTTRVLQLHNTPGSLLYGEAMLRYRGGASPEQEVIDRFGSGNVERFDSLKSLADHHRCGKGDECVILEEEDDDNGNREPHPATPKEPLIEEQRARKHASMIPIKTRRTSDVIVDLCTRSGADGKVLATESLDLRDLIAARTEDYLQDLANAAAAAAEDGKLPHPKQLLHYLAPKIPAIKHSPDVGLRIRSGRSDIDSGVAACLIGTLGHVCELYQKQGGSSSVSEDIVKDRRFEQLVECLSCGVNVKKERKEWVEMQQHQHEGLASSTVDDIEEILEDVQFAEGLSIRDSCRAAWGISILGVHEAQNKIGGENAMELLAALALRIRELLLVRLKKLRQSDLDESDQFADLSIDERLIDFSDELAEDAATALWTFACVRACTGVRCQPLVDVCCSILCMDPFDLRRRAQEIEATVDTTTVGSNDIVERLALSEVKAKTVADYFADQSNTTKKMDGNMLIPTDSAEVLIERKDSLLDWLSPKELTDAVWGFAVQESEDQTGLTDADDTFRDIAFDRIFEWLRKELNTLESTSEADLSGESLIVKQVENGSYNILSTARNSTFTEDKVPAVYSIKPKQVPDTLSLIVSKAGNNITTAAASKSVMESMTVTTTDDGVNQIQGVDASALLALETAQDGDDPDDHLKVIETPCIVEVPKFEAFEKDRSKAPFQFFSPHDLCSIAWAVTELNDSLRESVTVVVAKLVVHAGPDILKDLSGGDLSNLAWAVAKNINISDDSFRCEELAVLITGWIADDVLRNGQEWSETADQLRRFRPSEFSRLLWSIAVVHSTRVDGTRIAETSAHSIGLAGIKTAASNMDVFSTEDLARIAWAFLALSDFRVGLRPCVTEALTLGKILATIETSLLLWENGKLSSQRDSCDSTVREATRFSSFFRRARLRVPFLDSRFDDFTEDAVEPPGSTHPEKSRLPLLRDLPIDPLTLCKVACCFERLAECHEGVRVSETITRVSLRLFTSHNGRLMRECPIQDLVHLCEAAARTSLPSVREMIGLFARRFVRHLNGPGQHDLSALGAGESVTLVWALGGLGVKYYRVCEDASSAHRRLHLVTRVPFIDTPTAALDQLSNASAIKLLRGIVTMHVVAIDKPYVLAFLAFLERRLALITEESQLCEAIQSIGMLRMASESTLAEIKLPSVASLANSTCSTADDENLFFDEQIRDACDHIMSLFASRASTMVSQLRAGSLRTILTTLSSLPSQDDELIRVIEREVKFRLSMLMKTGHSNIAELLDKATASATAVDRILFGSHGDSSSTLSALKHRLKALFGSSGDGLVGEEETNDETIRPLTASAIRDKLRLKLKEALHYITAAAAKVETSTKVCHVSIDRSINTAEHDVLFELGRCSELIDKYRRPDFAFGAGQRRVDRNRGLDMTKRAQSRLLP